MGFCITKFFNTTLFMLEKIQYNEEFRIVVWSGSREKSHSYWYDKHTRENLDAGMISSG